MKMKLSLMVKLFLLSIPFVFGGCYTCQQSISINYNNCMDMRYDNDFCMKAAKMQAETDGYCEASTYRVNW